MRKVGFWAFIAGLVFALLPIASLLLAAGVAGLGDCQLDEASVHACVLLGIDWGGLLGIMAMAGWLALFTIPVGGLVALVGLVVYAIVRFTQKAHKKS